MSIAVSLLILRAVIGLALAAHGAQNFFGWFDGPGFGYYSVDWASSAGASCLRSAS